MNERAVITTRMARSAASASGEFGAYHHRNIDAPPSHIMVTRRMARQLIHGERQQIGELNFDNRSHAVDRRANRETDESRFGNRRAQLPLFTQLLPQAAR